jgi:hypothetical protein
MTDPTMKALDKSLHVSSWADDVEDERECVLLCLRVACKVGWRAPQAFTCVQARVI